MLRVARLEADERRGEQPLDGGHRVHERRALTSGERLEDRSGSRVRAAVELRSLAAPGTGEPRRPRTPVGLVRADRHELVRREALQDPSQIAGVEAEPGAQRPEVESVVADLPEHARLAERPVAPEERLVERADTLRDRGGRTV